MAKSSREAKSLPRHALGWSMGVRQIFAMGFGFPLRAGFTPDR